METYGNSNRRAKTPRCTLHLWLRPPKPQPTPDSAIQGNDKKRGGEGAAQTWPNVSTTAVKILRRVTCGPYGSVVICVMCGWVPVMQPHDLGLLGAVSLDQAHVAKVASGERAGVRRAGDAAAVLAAMTVGGVATADDAAARSAAGVTFGVPFACD